MTKRVIRNKGCYLERSKYFEIGISQDKIYSFQNGFHHEKGHILFLKLGISALGHQMPRLVTNCYGIKSSILSGSAQPPDYSVGYGGSLCPGHVQTVLS